MEAMWDALVHFLYIFELDEREKPSSQRGKVRLDNAIYLLLTLGTLGGIVARSFVGAAIGVGVGILIIFLVEKIKK